MVIINKPIDHEDLRRRIPLLASLNIAELLVIAQRASLQRYARKERIVMQGSTTESMYFVMLGSAHVVMEDGMMRQAIVSTLQPGDYFGEMSLIDHEPHVASVVAAKPTEILAIENSVFSRLLPHQRSVAACLMRTLVLRLRLASRNIESLSLLDVRGRIARVLLSLAVDDGHGDLRISAPISLTDIGKMIGASREAVSRVLNDLEARGLIKTHPSGTILLHAGGSLIY